MLSYLTKRILLQRAVKDKTTARDEALKASCAVEGEVMDRVGYTNDAAFQAGTDEAHLALEIAELELIDAEIALNSLSRDSHVGQIAVYKARIAARELVEAAQARARYMLSDEEID